MNEHKKKAKTVRSTGKVMATVFWDAQGIIYYRGDYLTKGQTITGGTMPDYWTS